MGIAATVKTWVIIAFLQTPVQPNVPPYQDLFVFTKPYFSTGEQCVSFVQANPLFVMEGVMSYYGPSRRIENVMCMEKEKFMKLMKEHSPYGKQTNGTSI